MTIEEITAYVESLDGVLALRPGPGDGSPEISWGDLFFYYAPDGLVPRTQPFATVVTKNYPDDQTSRLDRPDTFRLNVSAGTNLFVELTGHRPGASAEREVDPSTPDTVFAHPVYGQLGWVAVVNPGPRTKTTVRELLRTSHDLARARHQRRVGSGPPSS
jgi:hypothetical protein